MKDFSGRDGTPSRSFTENAPRTAKISSLALDPIEKKPLSFFHPGSQILSLGFFGCNLHCPFCQNHEISQTTEQRTSLPYRELSSEELVELALAYRDRGNIGLAYTYNEPLAHFRFVGRTAALAREIGLCNVLVTNGSVPERVLDSVLPWIDAMNVDIKSFSPDYYKEVLGGNLDYVKAFIEKAAHACHVELTTLLVPGDNDAEEEIREIASWIAGLSADCGKEIPWHITRFFPRYRYGDREPTPRSTVLRAVEIGKEYLPLVLPGNI